LTSTAQDSSGKSIPDGATPTGTVRKAPDEALSATTSGPALAWGNTVVLTIAESVAPNLTPVSFELGGKGANIVFGDADLPNAVAWSLRAASSNTGQVCLAGSRLYVQHGIYDSFLSAFTDGARQCN
jgi:acyl-CoA reductase-like NAD-dependent aldehyde dehydrogenase